MHTTAAAAGVKRRVENVHCTSGIDRTNLVCAMYVCSHWKECRMEMITYEKQKKKNKTSKSKRIRTLASVIKRYYTSFFSSLVFAAFVVWMTHEQNTYYELIIVFHTWSSTGFPASHIIIIILILWFLSSFCILLCHDRDVKRIYIWELIVKNIQLEQKHKDKKQIRSHERTISKRLYRWKKHSKPTVRILWEGKPHKHKKSALWWAMRNLNPTKRQRPHKRFVIPSKIHLFGFDFFGRFSVSPLKPTIK